MKRWLYLLIVLLSQISSAKPYYRFWRGWKLEALSEPDFREGLNRELVPQTVEVGAGKGLIAYLPVLLPELSQRPEEVASVIPDETALVVYRSEAEFNIIRSSPEGKSYGALHWKFFDQEKSKSLNPTTLTDMLVNDQAYDVLQSDSNWREGFATYNIAASRKSVTDYVKTVAGKYSGQGLVSYLVLPSNGYLIEFQLWSSSNSYHQSKSGLMSLRDRFLEAIPGAGGISRRAIPHSSTLDFGTGLNIEFQP